MYDFLTVAQRRSMLCWPGPFNLNAVKSRVPEGPDNFVRFASRENIAVSHAVDIPREETNDHPAPGSTRYFPKLKSSDFRNTPY
jgi:hypothetical protein